MTVTTQVSWLQGSSAAGSGTSAGATTLSGAGLAFAGVDLVRIGLALTLCLALGVVAILVLRRTQATPGKGLRQASSCRITVADTVRLGARATLHLVEYDDRVVLLASDAAGVKLLDAHDRPNGERIT